MENKTMRNQQEASQIQAASVRDDEEERIMSSSLPDDAILQILSKLPTKSILRFRCVCKHWCYNLFKDPNLVKARLEKSLVGIFVGRQKSLSVVRAEISNIWELKNEVTISIHEDHDYTSFVFDFKNSDDCKWVLEQGLIYISNSLFFIRPCSPLTAKNLFDLKTIPIWVFIYGLPLRYWNAEGLSKISSCLGVYLLADAETVNKTKLGSARVCVEIDLDFTYPSFIPLVIDGTIVMELRVNYQFKPSKCDGCKTFGHSPFNCPKKGLKENPEKNLLANKEQLNPVHDGSGTMENGGNCSSANENLEVANEGLNTGAVDNLTRRIGKSKIGMTSVSGGECLLQGLIGVENLAVKTEIVRKEPRRRRDSCLLRILVVCLVSLGCCWCLSLLALCFCL